MTLGPAHTLATLLLEHADFGTARFAFNHRDNASVGHEGGASDDLSSVFLNQQNLVERQFRSSFTGRSIEHCDGSRGDLDLTPAGLNDCVHIRHLWKKGSVSIDEPLCKGFRRLCGWYRSGRCGTPRAIQSIGTWLAEPLDSGGLLEREWARAHLTVNGTRAGVSVVVLKGTKRRVHNKYGRFTARTPLCLIAAIVAAVTAGCQVAAPTSPDASVGAPTGSAAEASAFSAELSLCVAEINRYRGSIGTAPLQRSGPLEAYASNSAQHDATVREAHAYFRSTNGGGVAKAETQILWWRGFATSQVIKKGLAQMWNAGPAGPHYSVLTGPYSEVGCGIFISNGEVTIAQDFR